MLNLRDPTFVSASERQRNTLENTTTHLDLTFIESHNPTQLSNRDGDGFVESEINRNGDNETTCTAAADLYLHDDDDDHRNRTAGKHLFFSFLPSPFLF